MVVPGLEACGLALAEVHSWWSSISLTGLHFPVLSRLELSLLLEHPFPFHECAWTQHPEDRQLL